MSNALKSLRTDCRECLFLNQPCGIHKDTPPQSADKKSDEAPEPTGVGSDAERLAPPVTEPESIEASEPVKSSAATQAAKTDNGKPPEPPPAPLFVAQCREYLRHGWRIIPIDPIAGRPSKKPTRKSWQHIQLTEADLFREFGPNVNVGVILGDVSGGLVDVDVDAEKIDHRTGELARRIVPCHLPQTATFGRKTNPLSHHLYIAPGLESEEFHDIGEHRSNILIEIRANLPSGKANQTVLPPSIHQDTGEMISWNATGGSTLTVIDSEELGGRVSVAAAAILLAKHYPPEHARNMPTHLLSGALAKKGWSVEFTLDFFKSVWAAVQEPKVQDREGEVQHSYATFAAGEKVAGVSKLAEFLPAELVERLVDYLGLRGVKEGAAEALAWIKERLNNPNGLSDADSDEMIMRAARLDRLELARLTRDIARKLKISIPDLKSVLKEKSKTSLPGGAIVYSLENYQECLRAAEKKLANLPGRYYECGKRLVIPVRARETEKKQEQIKNIERDEVSAVIESASKLTVRRDLIQHAVFVDFASKDAEPIFPPLDIIGDIFDRVRSETAEVPYEHLEMLVNTPVLLPSGTVHDAPGELREGVLFLAPDCEYPRVPDKPTREDALAALEKFKPLFCKFPFVTEHDGQPWYAAPSYAVVLAGCLTLVARSALRGRHAVPIIVSNGPKQRSGKTLIVETIGIGTLGHTPTTAHYINEEEFGKTLLPLMLSQDRAILLDNIERVLRSSKLALLLTGNRLRDRILGESTTVALVNRSVFFATGNNIVLAGDMAYRGIESRIDPPLERPEERKFDFDPRDLARKHHPELVGALLTALRAYIVADRKWELERQAWGGFEEWDRLVCGCLTWLGYGDPVNTRQDMIGEDPERAGNIGILQALFAEFKSNTFTVADIARLKTSDIYERLLSKEGKWNPETAAYRLNRLRDRIEGGLKLVRPQTNQSSAKRWWRVLDLRGKEDRDEENLPF